MKKIILIAAGVILTVSGFSQIKLGLQVTGTLASADVKSKYDINFDNGIAGLPGVSAVVQYDMNRHMSLRTGVTYLQQGTELKFSFDEFGSTTTRQNSITSRFRYRRYTA